MKKLAQLSFLLALVFGYISQAQAGLLVEPLVGYNINTQVELPNESFSGGTGAAFGGRLGYQNFGFQLGLDYLNSSIDMDDDVFNENLSLSEFAGFVGFEFPILVRVYAGYIFSATGESENASGQKFEFKSGTGTKLGLGFTGLPFVDINFEFRSGTFDKWETAGTEQDDEVKYQSFMVGLSLPLNL